MNATHTPTPWVVESNDRQLRRIMTAAPVYPGAEHPAHIAGGVIYRDAAFIVRACNAHDDLVSALRDAIRSIDEEVMAAGDDAKTHPVIRSHARIADKARAALAKAGAA